MPELQMRKFICSTDAGRTTISAAYWNINKERWIEFKDTEHAVVYACPERVVHSIERKDDER